MESPCPPAAEHDEHEAQLLARARSRVGTVLGGSGICDISEGGPTEPDGAPIGTCE